MSTFAFGGRGRKAYTSNFFSRQILSFNEVGESRYYLHQWINTVCLVDFCTCPADCCAIFPFLYQSYVAVLKQLSLNFKNDVFFSCNPSILKGCCLFLFFLGRISAGCLRFSTTAGLQKSTIRPVYHNNRAQNHSFTSAFPIGWKQNVGVSECLFALKFFEIFSHPPAIQNS